jgi:putative hydrolase of the HAD superfamily
MHELLKDKSVIFFDVGYTLDYPASGDWMFTNKFLEYAGEQMKQRSREEIRHALLTGFDYLEQNHRMRDEAEEAKQVGRFYQIVSDELGLNLSQEAIRAAAWDRTWNMDNYRLYPDAKQVLETLSRTHRLGLISDTWPSIENQLQTLGVRQYFSFSTYSFALGVFKPDHRMFLDALQKAGCAGKNAVFIDDGPRNLAGAAELGITPILIAANPASDVETPFAKIHALSELL